MLEESYLIDGTGYEAREISKEQTMMPIFTCMLEGPTPCTIFVLHSYTTDELLNI